MKKPSRSAKKAPPKHHATAKVAARKRAPKANPKPAKAKHKATASARPVLTKSKPAPRGKPAVKAPPARTAPRPPVRPPDPAALEREQDLREQAATFGKAMQLFHRGDFGRARDLFQRALDGPNREMAHTAQMHRKMCERRLSRSPVDLKNPEELYHFGVALMNDGRLDEAATQLRRSLAAAEQSDHVHYALALCLGLRGRYDEA
ncbi:MAG: tetratricopeptide repeat protein, partial [Bryobacteraceae bacterium]